MGVNTGNLLTTTVTGPADLLSVHRHNPGRYPFLLESVAKGADGGRGRGSELARFDILFAFPGERLSLNADSALTRDGRVLAGKTFLQGLDDWFRELTVPVSPSMLPFTGGWFTFLSYELSSQIEPVLNLPDGDCGIPVASAVRVPAAIINDHKTGQTILMAEPGLANLITEMGRDLRESRLVVDMDSSFHVNLEQDAPADYIRGVERIKEYIAAGDVFQVNLSRGWHGQMVVENLITLGY